MFFKIYSGKYQQNIAERFTRIPRVLKVWSQILDRPNLTQRCKRLATALTSTQVGVLPRRSDIEMGTKNSLHVLA